MIPIPGGNAVIPSKGNSVRRREQRDTSVQAHFPSNLENQGIGLRDSYLPRTISPRNMSNSIANLIELPIPYGVWTKQEPEKRTFHQINANLIETLPERFEIRRKNFFSRRITSKGWGKRETFIPDRLELYFLKSMRIECQIESFELVGTFKKVNFIRPPSAIKDFQDLLRC